MTPRELAIATSAIANAICDGHLPNRLNHAPSTINIAAVMPIGLTEAIIVRRDLDGSCSLAAAEQLLRETWPEHFQLKKEPQRVCKSQIAVENQQMFVAVHASKTAPRPWRPTPLRPPLKKAC
jgi:hypothetical protein